MNVDCGDFLYELWIRTDDARRFASERRIRTNAAVHDLMDAEPALLDDCGERDNEILDVGRAGPEIVHRANRLTSHKPSVSGGQKRILARTEDP